MARLTSIAALLSTMLLLGCQPDRSPSPGMGDFYPAPLNDPQISVLSPELRPWLAFHPAGIVDDGERPYRVEVPVRNMTDRQYLVDYRFLFYDEDGMEVTPTMGWEMMPMESRQVVRLRGSAMSTEAVNHRLELRWAR